MAGLCRQFGISRTTGYTWLERYQSGGAVKVVERSRRPLRSPRRTGKEIEEAVVELRRRWPDWGAPKLVRLLEQQQPGLGLCVRTVHRILARHRLIAEEDQRRPALRRFERGAPNELWQMDFKGPQGFNQGGGVGPLSVMDDHSRYLLALEHLGSTRMAGVQQVLQRTFEQNGLPEALLVDHGTPWWNTASPWGISELTVWIMRQGVRLLYSGIRHPQTQGKIERMHGALQRALRRRHQDAAEQAWLDAFRWEYNVVRPHAGIGMVTPASRWHRSAKTFDPHPPEWNYDAHQAAVRLAGDGQLWWQGHRYEISRALRHQLVGIEQIGERALVSFCNTPMRELDLKTGRSVPIGVNILKSLQSRI
jgi:transposase InsO family protein